eukprot:CAMPEP_0173130122 /NCGR_PEP_ID=MMETSP1102-20130122/59734_1 /TAXON_ID=49646 /ORGANISM="Geminigera sp., Strain Caron Lab Isolate" /LENGTH=359 /DNA_ID=CAMNT_0014040941 /DNA_START=88 /DNA_END=1165 /DNA_ORIENTATION=-
MGRKLSAARPDKPVPAGLQNSQYSEGEACGGQKTVPDQVAGVQEENLGAAKNVTKDNIVEWACKRREESIAKWVRKRSKERATRRAAVQAEKNKSGNSVGTLNRATDQCSISIISVAVQSGAQQTHARKKRKATEIAVPSQEGMDGQRNVGSVLSERSQAALGCSSQQDAFAAAAPVAASSSDGAQTKRVRFANDSPAVVEELQEKFSASDHRWTRGKYKTTSDQVGEQHLQRLGMSQLPSQVAPSGTGGRASKGVVVSAHIVLPLREALSTQIGHPGASSLKPVEEGQSSKEKGQSSRAGAGANHHPLPSVARMQGGDLIFVRISRIEEENRQTQQRIAELQDDVKELKAVIAELHNK